LAISVVQLYRIYVKNKNDYRIIQITLRTPSKIDGMTINKFI